MAEFRNSRLKNVYVKIHVRAFWAFSVWVKFLPLMRNKLECFFLHQESIFWSVRNSHSHEKCDDSCSHIIYDSPKLRLPIKAHHVLDMWARTEGLCHFEYWMKINSTPKMPLSFFMKVFDLKIWYSWSLVTLQCACCTHDIGCSKYFDLMRVSPVCCNTCHQCVTLVPFGPQKALFSWASDLIQNLWYFIQSNFKTYSKTCEHVQ